MGREKKTEGSRLPWALRQAIRTGTHKRTLAALTAALVAGCGGGGASTQADPPELALHVRLLAHGSVISCESSRPVQAHLTRAVDGTSTTQAIDCPSQQVLQGDHRLSVWQLAPLPLAVRDGSTLGLVTATTKLLPPVVLRDGDSILVLPASPLASSDAARPLLQRLSTAGEHLETLTDAHSLGTSPSARGEHLWRWSVALDGTTYVSDAIGERSFTMHDTGVWGAMALADLPDGRRLLGADDYVAMGAGSFTDGRTFRDIRYVDLNNDGRLDIVSNVYGSGCALIAMAKAAGGYDVQTPLRNDASCIGGHGETLLVADFDGDGLVDIFLPSYQRFDYLKNMGEGRFVEMADALGIAFPEYRPNVEGAAAVDVELDGDVDIVVASEVLLNDGNGNFTHVDRPFGPERVFDEGMSVADLDGDGAFDIVMSDPAKGPRIFWGTATPHGFDDAGWMFGGTTVSANAFGIAVGDLTGDGLPDIVLAGGAAVADLAESPAGRSGFGPRLCAQVRAREFQCLTQFVPPIHGAWSDLVMVTDINGDGTDELVARYGALRTYRAPPAAGMNTFRIDLRDAAGRRTLHGRALTARCAIDGSLVALKSVDGGNGYMAQGEYIVSFNSAWCPRVEVHTGGPAGAVSLGTYPAGTHVVSTS